MKSARDYFAPGSEEKMTLELERIESKYQKLLISIGQLTVQLNDKKAQEYLLQGAGRRFKLLRHSIQKIHKIFPFSQKEKLGQEQVDDVTIYMHAFVVNIYGLLDNLAWTLIFEKKLEKTIPKHSVSLFKNETVREFSEPFISYLNSESFREWREKYLTYYRHSIAHRVPLYVPPFILLGDENIRYQEIENELREAFIGVDLKRVEVLEKEQGEMGSVFPFFCGSVLENIEPIAIHAQMFADFNTVEELTVKFIGCFKDSVLKKTEPIQREKCPTCGRNSIITENKG